MEELIRPANGARNFRKNIEKFEGLSLQDATVSRPPSNRSKISILDDNSVSDVQSEPFTLRPSVGSTQSSVSAQPTARKHKRHDSTAFLQKSYLAETASASLPDDAREILKSQPDREDLAAVLQYLQYGIDGRHDFNVRVPGPKASQIVNVMVTVTIPDQWLHLRRSDLSKSDAQMRRSLLNCLNSVAGLGALLMQIRRVFSTTPNHESPLLDDLISVLSLILSGSHALRGFLSDAFSLFKTETHRRVFWQEITSLLAGSKILSTMAHVLASLRDSDVRYEASAWLGDARQYSQWLARNISTAAVDLHGANQANSAQVNLLCQVLKRGLSLGYRDTLITELYSSLLLGKRALWTTLHNLVQPLPAYDQTGLFDAILRDLARRFLPGTLGTVKDRASLMSNSSTIGAVAAMVKGLVQNNAILEAHVIQWLTSTNGEYAGLGLDTRRAVIATLASHQDKLQEVLEKSLERFGNKIQIQHDPIVQQESTAQTILLALGYLNHLNPQTVKQISSSSTFLRMVSTRLSASVPRARFLGMIVAVAMSKSIDKPDKVMDFGVEEIQGEDAQRWLDLVNIRDSIGSLADLPKTEVPPGKMKATSRSTKPARPKRVSVTSQPHSSKVIAIEEVDETEHTGSDEEELGLRPYARPDSDPSDSDDDPTLINRNKPSAPVYITSLIKQLNANDDPSTVELALKTAPSLIRRKANFGDELSSNIIQLAAILVNLQEGMSKEEMHQLRIEALIACLVAKPAVMGPWLAGMYFEGDLSISQRASLLTAMGLGARELAGIDDEIEKQPVSSRTQEGGSSFPSKKLPPHLDSTYATTSAIDMLSTTLSHRTLQPMALEAADKVTGPDILKVRTFSSRMAVAAKEAAKAESRSKRIPKDLHKLLSEALYLPLCSRLTLLLSALSTTPYLANSTLLHPSLLKLSLQTLVVLISTIGPNALQLPMLTRESLLLLTELHTIPSLAHDPIILPPALHLLLTLLDLSVEAGPTAEERLVTDFGHMLAELVSWAAGLAERVPITEVDADPGLGMAMPWTVLVAGIQVKWQEIGRKFQGRMLGLMAGTDFDTF
ncbi:hypothetical protein A1O1_05225 [Capronia coronata CBS 617.96]|uniref:Telomere length regulation protein conserved domain-containing protein n=1 Tax=Capronia coronata CBS 617.96 TaxID=1182541 RepID=W9YF39_9EURO|nr:uncharacterized protein A1O1_05225 [Capronia coronata CBS 617.96]EXJ88295.1 hypothetical protein A1O1_05225 [Capronia coronata CBS 617.96]